MNLCLCVSLYILLSNQAILNVRIFYVSDVSGGERCILVWRRREVRIHFRYIYSGISTRSYIQI